MAAQTPIHGFDLPTVGADSDAWGAFLNGNWSDLDTLLAVDITATFLPVAGGTMTGQIVLPTGGTGNEAVTVDEADAAASAAAGVVQGNLDTHEADVSNPHVVTAAQLSVLPLGGGTMTGQIILPTGGTGDEAITVDEVVAGLALKAPIASPEFTGNPLAPTPDEGDNDTSIATTAFVTVAIAAIALIPPVVKAADETVNNSSTLQNDNDLVFALEANITYEVDLVLLLNAASASPDFKFGWTVPSGCVMFWESAKESPWGSESSGDALKGAGDSLSTATPAGTNGAIYKAIVRNGANAGNLQLRWAQNSANASNSKVLKHSHMNIRSLGAT